MKTDLILIALGIGIVIALVRLDYSLTTIAALKYEAFACLGIYYGMRRFNNKNIDQDPKYKIVLGETFGIGMRICLIASLSAGALYSIIPDSTKVIYESGKLIRTLDVSVSILIIGIIISIVGSFFLVKRQF